MNQVKAWIDEHFKGDPIIWAIVILPEEKTMALGGVETGSAEPKLQPNVSPISGGTGSMPCALQIANTTGISAAAAAALLVTSLSKMPPAIASAVIVQRSG